MPREAAAPPTLRAAFEATGSGSWVMRTIIEHGLDRAHGYRLRLGLGGDRLRSGRQATEAQLIDGFADVIDTDWMSLARLRRSGLPLVAAAPYGAIFGGLAAPAGGVVRDLPDLVGRRIGVVHAGDKNWLLLRAACRRRHGFDPALEARCVETGSKTALAAALAEGAVDAALLYWHQIPPLLASGACTEICDLLELLPGGAAAATPSTFFVVHDTLLATRPGLVRAFAASVAEAVSRLRGDELEWQRASGAGDACSGALRRKWCMRVGLPWAPEMIDRLRTLAVELTDRTSGALDELPPGLFAADLLQ